jgi:cob(I)alamin adenosyltransferase
MAFKIYTKTGDLGKTSLIGGTKVLKSHLRIESYGGIDELNSYIGLVNDLLATADLSIILREIQDRLFTIGSSLACDPDKDSALKIPDLHVQDVERLEKEIDRMNEVLPDMRSFILPGGHPTISHIHIARCICRRAERNCVNLQAHDSFVEPLVLQYLNRLSDYLFVLARYAGYLFQVQDIPWKPRV